MFNVSISSSLISSLSCMIFSISEFFRGLFRKLFSVFAAFFDLLRDFCVIFLDLDILSFNSFIWFSECFSFALNASSYFNTSAANFIRALWFLF